MATAKKKTIEAKGTIKQVTSKEKYVYAVGRRKTAVAQVRYFSEAKVEGLDILVNGRPYAEYFHTFEQRAAVEAPLKTTGKNEGIKITVLVMGGGHSGQADAVKLAIARALVDHDILLRPSLKAEKHLTRDSRAVERKKPGLHKARRAPQWAKR